MELTIDFETRSAIDLLKCGSWIYSKDSTTQVICLAVTKNNDSAKIFITPYFYDIIKDLPEAKDLPLLPEEKLIKWLKKAKRIEAHNATFEMDIYYNHILNNPHLYPDWPEIPHDKWRCSAAKAAAHALPRKLEDAADALDTKEKKDTTGHKLMLKLSKPRKPRKKEKEENPYYEDTLYWYEDPKEYLCLMRYCLQDVNTEKEFSEKLIDLNIKEQKVWQLDSKINRYGIPVDIDAVESASKLISIYKDKLANEFRQLTENKVNKPTQGAKLIAYINDDLGFKIENLTKVNVENLLNNSLTPEKVRKLLKIRQSLSKSSTAKLDKFLLCTDRQDNRVHGALLYHGATTGRWGGRLIQPHNFPRGDTSNVDAFISDIKKYKDNPEMIEMLYGDPMAAISGYLRGFIAAHDGRQLICSDYSSIEARVLAWLAGADKILDAFKRGLDLYKVAAADIYNVKYENVTKEQRQVGKVAILALGYQGAWRAFAQMAVTYGVKPPDNINLESEDYYDYDGEKLTKEEALFKKWATPIVLAWRIKNPEIKQFWYDTEAAATKAIKHNIVSLCGKTKWGMHRNFLFCQLPSGRYLSYYKPFLSLEKTPFGVKEVIKFYGADKKTGKLTLQSTYGGKLVENITQAVARDLLVESMLLLDKKGYNIVMHVHDEIIADIPEGEGSVKEFEKIMSKQPHWGADIPLVAADGWIGKRYRK